MLVKRVNKKVDENPDVIKTKKKTAKKTTKKKISKSSKKPKFELKKVYGDECFYVIDGSVLSDLTELSEAFDHMSEDVFNYHVNDERNDFENWVRYVFNEHELADQINKQKKPEKCHVTMLKFFLKHK